MSFPRLFWFAAAAIALAIAGCKINTINSFPTRPATVRYINFVPDSSTLTVQVGSTVAFADVPFGTPTDYQQFDNRQTQFDVYAPEFPGQVGASAAASLAGEQAYTLLSAGPLVNSTAFLQTDNTTQPTPTNTQYRATHVAFSTGPLDFYLTAPGVALGSVSPNFSLGFNGTTTFVRVNTGNYQLRLVRSSVGETAFDSGTISLPDQASDTYYIYAKTGVHALSVLRVGSGDSAAARVPNTLAALKVVNAAYQTPSVDQKFADGTVGATNVAYNTATGTYFTIPGGPHTVTFEDHAAPGATIASADEQFDVETDSTVLLSGANGSLVITKFADSNLAPPQETARLRVINASADVPAFDLVIDGDVKATNVAYTQATAYFDLSNSNHKVELRVPGTSTSILTLDSQQFSGAAVTTLYLMGPATALKTLITIDSA
jgi:hypothetical protein